MNETLRITGGQPGLLAFVSRVAGLNATAAVRLRQLPDGVVDAFATTPFEVVAARRFRGEVARDGAVVGAEEMRQALALVADQADPPTAAIEVDLGPARDPSWPGALPPAEGFQLIEELPVAEVRKLADEGQALTRQFSGPLGPPTSLLNQPVVTAEAGGQRVEIPMRMIFACINLQLIPSFAAPIEVPRHLRISGKGRWVRLDAPFGTIYHSTRLSLF